MLRLVRSRNSLAKSFEHPDDGRSHGGAFSRPIISYFFWVLYACGSGLPWFGGFLKGINRGVPVWTGLAVYSGIGAPQSLELYS